MEKNKKVFVCPHCTKITGVLVEYDTQGSVQEDYTEYGELIEDEVVHDFEASSDRIVMCSSCGRDVTRSWMRWKGWTKG